MAKILISSIGVGRKQDGGYKKAKYKCEKEVYETSFIADALNQHYNFDKFFFIGTKKSIWDEAYITFGGSDKKYHEKLYEQQDSGQVTASDLEPLEILLKNDSKTFLIDYGINDEQLWSNFENFLEIANHIQDGDEIYLDITHSFRSLSLMSFVMTQFASSISDKKFKITKVLYGMFEYNNENNGITPIVDIKILLDIQEWIKAIDAIKKYSDFDPLVTLLKSEDIEEDVKNAFIQLNNSLKMVNLSALEIFIKNASKKIKTISNSSNKIVQLLAPEIIKLVEELDKDIKSQFQYSLAKWFFKNKNYGLSYLALYEAIISKSCELKSYDVEDYNSREEAKRKLGNDKYGQYFYTKPDNPDFKNSVSNIRNAIAHQSNDRKNYALEDIKRLKQHLKTFEEYILI